MVHNLCMLHSNTINLIWSSIDIIELISIMSGADTTPPSSTNKKRRLSTASNSSVNEQHCTSPSDFIHNINEQVLYGDMYTTLLPGMSLYGINCRTCGSMY